MTQCATFCAVWLDTSSEALHAQTLAQRQLGAAGRLRTACMMSQSLHEMAKDRIRRQHPQFDERAVLDHLVLELYGIRRNTRAGHSALCRHPR